MQVLPPALSPLSAWPQFVVWVAEPDPEKPGKLKKFPIHWQTGARIDAHDPAGWTTAEVALAMAPKWNLGWGSGGGFVLTERDPFFFLDIDGAWDGREWSAVARHLCAQLAGCAVELSMSQTGLHILGRTAALDHRSRNTPNGLELYTSKRFVALTGMSATGDAAFDATGALATIAAEYFPPRVDAGQAQDWSTGPVPEFTGPTDDDDLIRRGILSSGRSANVAFGGKASFKDLWECNTEALARIFPGDKGPYDASSADQSLANLLAFWTGKDCARMERLMRRSGLARDKYDSRRPSGTYLTETILNACKFISKVYDAAPLAMPPPTQHGGPVPAPGGIRDMALEYMPAHEQPAYFDGCYFNNMTGQIYSLTKNTEMDKRVFDVNFGGHLFIIDPSGRKNTDSAWDAMTKSRVNRPNIVDGLVFRPELAPGALVSEGNRLYLNSYVPHNAPEADGDPAPFLNHLAKLFPNDQDQRILLSYMASLVQNPGRKFQWWPVLQGAEGNGKTVLFSILEYAMGAHYTHAPNAAAMARDGNKFNSWLYRKLLVLVEEVQMSSRREFLEEFKPVITNERLEIEGKGANQFMGDNRANGLLATNHKAGVPINIDGRRYAVFFGAQQTAEDVLNAGMDARYFSDLWDWVKGRGAYGVPGAAIVTRFLRTMEIEAELDPARLSVRAPVTSSTVEALRFSMGRAEQEIMDACEEEKPGFAGGWISGFYLNELLQRVRANIPREERPAVLKRLGYMLHPSLPRGRTLEKVAPENTRSHLYLRVGHIALNERDPAAIARLYTQAQMKSLAAGAFGVDAPVKAQ